MTLAVVGHFFRPLAWPTRILLAAGALGMLHPELISDFIGALVSFSIMLLDYRGHKKELA